MRPPTVVLSLLLSLSAAVLPAQADGPAMEMAEHVFEQYVKLEQEYDSAVADLYADDALIQNTRRYPTGQSRTLTFEAPKYKELIRQAMPVAKARNDANDYLDVKYAAEGERVRITCRRYSRLKQYFSPLSLLVGPGPDGRWVIVEELSESQP